MENELKQLGLTPNEIKVYQALLELGENTVGPLIKKLGMHRQVAYDALKGLEEKRMVVGSTKNQRRYFRIANPKNILENIKQKESLAETLIEEINKKLSGQINHQEIRVYEGEKAYREFIKRKDDLQPPNTTYMVSSGVSMRYKDMMMKTGVYERSNRIRTKKNIKTKLLLNASHRPEAGNLKRVNSETRFLPEGYTSPASFDIWHDSISLISFEKEVFCIEIKGTDFYNSYVNYFNLLWSIAKE